MVLFYGDTVLFYFLFRVAVIFLLRSIVYKGGVFLRTYSVSFLSENLIVQVVEGTTLLEAERQAGLEPNAPCGGRGTCGKCRVNILEGSVKGIQKACQIKVTQDMGIELLNRERKYSILTKGISRSISFKPLLQFGEIQLPKVKIGEKLSDWERLEQSLKERFGENAGPFLPDFDFASSLFQMQKQSETWYAVISKNQILDIQAVPFPCYLAAFDIGTTTIVGYLLDAKNGETLCVQSLLNPQVQYGADVILRSNYVLENGGEVLAEVVRTAICSILKKLCQAVQIKMENIYQVCMVGNTCMHHLFLNLSPNSLVHAPYTPVVRRTLYLKTCDYQLPVNQRGQLIMLPNIAGFVGADTMGCLLCIRPDMQEEISLMIDIGTNGELVLGNKKGLLACSTAAGPAFEGAKIECGMRGSLGAIDHVTYEDGKWSYTTIGGEKAIGICGSGLIDLIACLRKAELVDKSGKLLSGKSNAVFTLVSEEESGNHASVYLSQKDIRELQLAKAAISAGIQILCQKAEISLNQIEKVYLAGAFGNYMNPDSACQIGLIPSCLRDKIVPVGNAAGEGAKIALLNRDELSYADTLSKKIDFVELATFPNFQDCFVDELEFS